MDKSEIALQLTIATINQQKLLEEPMSKIDKQQNINEQLAENLGKYIANLYNAILDNIN